MTHVGGGGMTIGAVTASIDRECCQMMQYCGARERMAVDSWGVEARQGNGGGVGGVNKEKVSFADSGMYSVVPAMRIGTRTGVLSSPWFPIRKRAMPIMNRVSCWYCQTGFEDGWA